MDVIERTQERLAAELQEVRAQLARVQVGGVGRGAGRSGEKEEGEVSVVEVAHEEREGAGEFKSAAEIAIEELQKKVDGAIDTIKLECVSLVLRWACSSRVLGRLS